MANEDLSSLAQRLDRIERALTRFTWLDDLFNPIVDPPPDDLGRIRPELLRLIELIRRPPRGDPPALDLTRLRGTAVQERLNEILRRNPGWFTDPPAEDFLNVRLLDLIRRWRGGFTDPAPDDLANVRLRDLLQRLPGGGIADPAAEDLARLTKLEVETQLHKIGAEMIRLKSLERLFNDCLSKFNDGKSPGGQ
jgi:hypothetical protein